MNKTLFWSLILILSGFCLQCSNNQKDQEVSEGMQKSFDPSFSDEKAVELAKEVIDACGGQSAWENTKYIAWTFFNRRRLLWDKQNHLARIRYLDGSFDAIVNLIDQTGVVSSKGKQLVGTELEAGLKKAYRHWINDSYWLVLPFKLLDPGVKLKYTGERVSRNEIPSEVIELTFEEVGVTPENKYEVYIGKQSNLIVQWNYFKNWTDTIPEIQNIWEDYMMYGDIFLSGNRGHRGNLDDIKVYDQLSGNPLNNLSDTHF